MAVRTDATEVQGILGLDWDAGNPDDERLPRSVQVFIDSATLIVDQVEACAVRKGITLPSALLVKIEAWLAACLYCASDSKLQSKSTAGASGAFQTGIAGQGFSINDYGRTAMAMDSSGCLRAIGEGKRAVGVTWLGKAPSEQIPYRNRS